MKQSNADTHQKIAQLFDSADEANVTLACELMKGNGMPPSIAQKLQNNPKASLYFFAKYGLVQHFAPQHTLDLSRLGIATLPPTFTNLGALKHLDLSFNQLTALPESLAQLHQLKRLWVYQNQLTVLPVSIGELPQLEELSLCFNRIDQLPASIAQLTSLRVLHLHHNRLTKLPLELNHLPHLEKITLWGNAFSIADQTLLPDVFNQVKLVF